MFKLESAEIFTKMVDKINNSTVSSLMRGQIPVQIQEEVKEAASEEATPKQQYTESHEELNEDGRTEAAQQDTREQTQQPIVREKAPGRNDPCPCGSGKKFKNCHGKGLE